MAKLVVNPEAELPSRAGDIELELGELAALATFASIKKLPFEKFPGTTKLRHYLPGEVICHQSQPGRSAFYMLTLEDLRLLSGVAPAESDTAGGAAAAPATTRVLEPVRQLHQKWESAGGAPRRLASAILVRDAKSPANTSESWWNRTLGRFGKAQTTAAPEALQAIPNDGPTDIDYESGKAAILAGEVFGEMSCLTRQPRSATVVAEEECFVLEFLRNVLDQMRRDPQYKKRSDEKYRERVMEGHVRNFSIFRALTPAQFREKASRIELMDLEPGRILFDEGEAPDAVYVVRSGILQVLQSYPWRLSQEAVRDWEKFFLALQAGCRGEGPLAPLAGYWSNEFKQQITAEGAELTDALRELITRECDEVAKSSKLPLDKQLQSAHEHPIYVRATNSFGEKPKNWNDLEIRRANRVLLHVLLPELVSAPEPLGAARVLSYAGRGSTQGEIGLILNQPRSATCIAYAHQEATGESTNVELLRISAELFQEIVDQSPEVRREMQGLIEARLRTSAEAKEKSIQDYSSSKRAEELGLLQGQKLMLIDLDRCTRCGDCVEACIATHDDGYSRLYLDGPQFGNYLVPSSCRNCRDPVCMIGCPVGSIQQGDSGEVLIRDWCIGCGVCARQCPYDALQMHDRSVLPSGAPGWRWMSDSGNISERWTQRNFRDRDWPMGSTPVTASIALELMARHSGKEQAFQLADRYYFRYWLNIDREHQEAGRPFRLLITAQGGGLEASLDGSPLQLSQDKKQEKNGIFQAEIAPELLRVGSHLLAVGAEGCSQAGEVIFDAQLDQLPLEEGEVEEKLVSEHAVVCDQCSSLSGNRHACVYACPHEAAMRIDAWTDLPTV